MIASLGTPALPVVMKRYAARGRPDIMVGANHNNEADLFHNSILPSEGRLRRLGRPRSKVGFPHRPGGDRRGHQSHN